MRQRKIYAYQLPVLNNLIYWIRGYWPPSLQYSSDAYH